MTVLNIHSTVKVLFKIIIQWLLNGLNVIDKILHFLINKLTEIKIFTKEKIFQWKKIAPFSNTYTITLKIRNVFQQYDVLQHYKSCAIF